MDTEAWYQNKLASIEDDFDFKFDSLVLDITETIRTKLKEKGITQTKLADRLNVSSAAISKLLRGESNFTIKKLVELAEAIELKLEIKFVPEGKVSEVPVQEIPPYILSKGVCIRNLEIGNTEESYIPSLKHATVVKNQKSITGAAASSSIFFDIGGLTAVA